MCRLALTILALNLALSNLALGEEVEPTIRGSGIVEVEDLEQREGYDFGDLTHRFRIFLNGMPWFQPHKEIDRMVGDPWRVDERTLEKMNSLPIRARLELFSAILSAVDQIRALPTEDQVFDSRSQGPTSILYFEEDDEYEVELSRRVRRVLKDPFTEEDWADIGVFLLSKCEFFPKTEGEWEHFKNEIINYALWPALAILVYQGISGQLNVSTSGWFLRNDKDTWRLGWFAKAKANWNEPELEVGLRSRTPSTELDVGYRRRFSDDPEHAFETLLLDARTFFLKSFVDAYGWNTFGSFRMEIPSRQMVGKEEFDPKVWASVYGRKQGAFGDAANTYTTEFRVDTERSAWAWINSVELDGKQLVVQILQKRNREDEKEEEISGLVIGYLGSERKHVANQMNSIVRSLRRDHRELFEFRQKSKLDAKDFDDKTKQDLDREILWLEWGHQRLSRSMDEYIKMIPPFLASKGKAVENTSDIHRLTGLGQTNFLNMLVNLAETSAL